MLRAPRSLPTAHPRVRTHHPLPSSSSPGAPKPESGTRRGAVTGVGGVTHILGSGRGRRYSRGTGRTSHAVALAEALAGAEARREPLALPATIGLDEEDAYEAQEHFVALRRVRTGEAVAGYKISMTSPETRALAGAHGAPVGGGPTRVGILSTGSPFLQGV